jgi:SNF2 family DNA or RNA helicase
MAFGYWRVPIAQLGRLADRLAPFRFSWEPRADVLRRDYLGDRAKYQHEDQLALLAKAGQSPLGVWQVPVPLLDHQRIAVDFLAVRTGCLLCDEQGLGKTLSALTAFWLLRARGEITTMLVACPNSLKFTWRDEVARFFPSFSVSIASGYKSRRRQSYEQKADIYIVNYEAARSDFTDLRLMLRRSRTVLVCDESHATKNAWSRTAHALRFLRSAAARVWMMSGTPVPNKLEDSFAQVSIADGGRLLGTREEFWKRYVRRTDRSEAISDLKEALAPILLRRTKDEVIDLPDKVFEARYVELHGEQRRMYNAVRRRLYEEIAAMPEAAFERALPNVLTRLLRLSQVASNPRLVFPDYAGEPAKMKEIDALLEDLIEAGGRKVVLWSHYVKTIEEFRVRHSRYNPVAIYGSIGLDERREAVRKFQNDPKTMLFIGNPQAAGTGLTLTAAYDVIYETLTWRYDLYAQSVDRTHRIGQARSVTYFNILAADTIDVAISESLERKAGLAATLLGDTDRQRSPTRQDVIGMLRPGG